MNILTFTNLKNNKIEQDDLLSVFVFKVIKYCCSFKF